jgi:predicted acetyltransferase
MSFDLRDVTEQDGQLVERLWQLYSHDMSEVRGTLPNDEGLYRPGCLPGYFGNPDGCGFLVLHDGAPVGFAFVDGLTGPTRKMGDFFVVRGVRRQGIASGVARALFAQYPGPWEIPFQAGNPGAPEFWRRVATDTVGTAWREELRPVPNKPHIPHDHFIMFSTGRA